MVWCFPWVISFIGLLFLLWCLLWFFSCLAYTFFCYLTVVVAISCHMIFHVFSPPFVLAISWLLCSLWVFFGCRWLVIFLWCFHMVVNKIPCPFRGRYSCNIGGGKGLTKKYIIDHLGSRHFSSDESKLYLKDYIASDFCLFSSLDIALKKAGTWLCGECLHTHSFSKNCKHADNSVILAPSLGDNVIHDIPFPLLFVCVPSVVNGVPP